MTGAIEESAAGQRLHAAQARFVLPAGARQIILVRHGSAGGLTVDVRLPFGPLILSDPPLWPAGHEQAAAVGKRLAREPIDRIFVTPLQRTSQTAAPLVALTGIEPVAIGELREAHLGDWEHCFYERAAAGDPLLRRMLVEETWEVLPNGERMDEFSARIRIGIGKIVAAMRPDSTAVSFSHAGTIAEICRQATASRPFAFAGPENGSISRLVVQADGAWSLRSFNDVAHLPEAG